MEERETPTRNPFAEEADLAEFLSVLGIEDVPIEDVLQEDGSIVLAIGDRAVTLEAHDAVAGVVITALIARVTGAELDGIVHDMMALNARPHTTGGLIFGIMGEDIVVGSLIVSETRITARVLADAVEAVVESTEAWRRLIEQTGSAMQRAEAGQDEDAPHATGPIPFA